MARNGRIISMLRAWGRFGRTMATSSARAAIGRRNAGHALYAEIDDDEDLSGHQLGDILRTYAETLEDLSDAHAARREARIEQEGPRGKLRSIVKIGKEAIRKHGQKHNKDLAEAKKLLQLDEKELREKKKKLDAALRKAGANKDQIRAAYETEFGLRFNADGLATIPGTKTKVALVGTNLVEHFGNKVGDVVKDKIDIEDLVYGRVNSGYDVYHDKTKTKAKGLRDGWVAKNKGDARLTAAITAYTAKKFEDDRSRDIAGRTATDSEEQLRAYADNAGRRARQRYRHPGNLSPDERQVRAGQLVGEIQAFHEQKEMLLQLDAMAQQSAFAEVMAGDSRTLAERATAYGDLWQTRRRNPVLWRNAPGAIIGGAGGAIGAIVGYFYAGLAGAAVAGIGGAVVAGLGGGLLVVGGAAGAVGLLAGAAANREARSLAIGGLTGLIFGGPTGVAMAGMAQALQTRKGRPLVVGAALGAAVVGLGGPLLAGGITAAAAYGVSRFAQKKAVIDWKKKRALAMARGSP